MVSKAEQFVSRSLRTILADLPNGTSIITYTSDGRFYSKPLRDFFGGLEFFLPQVLREIHPEWEHESLDGFFPLVARKTGEGEAEVYGLCILITDQTLTPIHVRLQVATSTDEVSWLECRLGDRGTYGMVRTPYDSPSIPKRLYLLEGRQDQIDWVYKVTFGDRRQTIDLEEPK